MKPWIGHQVLRAMRPLFAWRGRIVCRYFCKEARFYDKPVRRVIEVLIDIFEGWEMQPSLDRMRAQADECDRIAYEIEEVRRRFDLDAPAGDTKGLDHVR